MEQHARMRRGIKRLLALAMCMGLGFLPCASIGDNSDPLSLPTRKDGSLAPTSTGRPWYDYPATTPSPTPVSSPTSTPTPSPTPVLTVISPTPVPTSTPSHTPGPSPAPAAVAALAQEELPGLPSTLPGEKPSLTEDPSDTGITESQANSLVQNAELETGEAVEDYFTLPEGITTRRDGTFSILLIGMDSHKGERRGRSDAMILANLNVKTGAVKLISFLRDMYVKIPGQGMNRLNAAYYYGGADLLKKTLKNNFGVETDCTVAVDFSAMAQVIDQLGGITLTISEKERTQLNALVVGYSGGKNAQQVAAAGEQHLSGIQALCYSRIRKIDSDFQRTSRQHKVLEAMLQKALQQGLPKLMTLLSNCWGKVETDATLADVAALLPMLLKVKRAEFSAMHVPLSNAYQDDVVNGMMVLVPNLKKNAQAIGAFLGE